MAALSKAEYLKRYLSKDDLPKEEKIKKRRKIKSSKDSKLKIIDDDIDLKQLKQHQSKGEDLDEAPIVAEIIDERPKHVQQLEQYRKNSRWKVLGEDDEDGTSALDYGVIDKSLSKGSSSKRHDISSADDSSPKREKFSNNDTQHHNSSNKSSKADDGNYKTGSRHSNQRLDSDSDNSPVRKQNFSKINAQKKGSSSKIWPDRGHTSKVRHDSDSDNSPPRKKQTKRDTTKSETKISDGRNGHQSDSDPSPPWQKNTRHDSDSDHSPKRRHKHSSESDRSPPRRHKQASESDQSPPRKRKQSSESDQSPPRRRKQASESDQSPPRRRKGERHESPKGKKSSSSTSQSSSREKRDSEPGTRHSRFDSEPKEDNTKKAKKTLGGAKAGLSSAKDMIEEAKRLREKEEKAFGKIDESMLGRNAATVVRDKETGKRKNMAEEQAKNAEEEKRKEELNKQYQLWGKGMKQQANRASALEEQAYEASKPFARHSDDVDLDRMQRCEMRLEDPMLNHYRTKQKKEEEKSGKTAKKELPKYTGTAPPPNRYNLMPGYRWDGVDRSNGFERKIFAQQANKKAVQEIAYKWSTEDM
ncbi:unnamed protein product [Lymnaea stagnalis]|uniref:BUD13 homolog n=1 Tax=Lymnaea stagnalis TaxID=6523 RepID=A0AAV2I1B1_LYMST